MRKDRRARVASYCRRDLDGGADDFLRDAAIAAQRRLVIEEDARAGVDAVAVAVVDGRPVRGRFCRRVRTAWLFPDGGHYGYVDNGNGTFTPPSGNYQSVHLKPTDPSVVDFESAVAHEWSHHLDLAVNAAIRTLGPLESIDFASFEDCDWIWTRLVERASLAFSDTIANTQQQERAQQQKQE